MDTIQLIFLGIVQGLTEFLPISSSAHLVLISKILAWPDQGLLLDVAAHAGSLVAVLVYFRLQLWQMAIACCNPSVSKNSAELRLLGHLFVATLPIVIVALFAATWIERYTRDPSIIATTTIVFALLLGYAAISARELRDEYQLSLGAVLLIGCAQVLALIPGTSRAGITLTAALLLGQQRSAAARFSLLLSIPTIFAAVVYKARDLSTQTIAIDWSDLCLVMIVSALVAYLCIAVFLRLITSIGLIPFVVYRLALGAALLLFL